MRRRRIAIGLAVSACLAVTGSMLWWFNRPEPEISLERFSQIRPGMSFAQVRSIIGGPPGNYADEGAEDYLLLAGEGWIGDYCTEAKQFGEVPGLPELKGKVTEGTLVTWLGGDYA